MMHMKKIAQINSVGIYKSLREYQTYRVEHKDHGPTTMRGWPFASVLNLAQRLTEENK